MAFVYRHIRLDKNEPFYIGIGSSKARCYTKGGRNKHWHSIVKHTPYRVDIIFDDLALDEAKEKEKEFIALYGKKSNGGTLVNITDGGDGAWGVKASEERKEQMRKFMMEKNPFLGKKHTEETREKMRMAKLGKPKPQIAIDKHKITMLKYKGMKRWNSTLILDTLTGIYYQSIKEAAQSTCIHLSSFMRRVNKKNSRYIRV